MARKTSFDMNTVLTITDVAAAKALSAKLRAQHHKDLLDITTEAQGDGPVTCAQVVEAYDTENLTEEQARIYNKYSKSAHMQYLINRCRGVIVASLNGKELVPTTTAGKAPKAKKVAEAPQVAVEAPAEAELVEA